MEDFPSRGSSLAAKLALLPGTMEELDLASQEEEAPRPGKRWVPGLGAGVGGSGAKLPALHQLSRGLALMSQLGKCTLQLAILFYWLMWASGQEELGLNQYSFYYVIIAK